MTPLKLARTQRRWTLKDVSARLAQLGGQVDTGNLSRIERGEQRASVSLAESLCRVFNTELADDQKELTEIHILYPERFKGSAEVAA
ncbi:transcriptional regulator [Pseudomonas sp. UMC65]|uniref:helix-turn-helix domain-containing protein n=1 Tax=unclassified Pseudomonas TaxID=196821 RepID=UPI0016018355|nr:helix-turn-helix transcriptional regulator [Pseudomonas sp. UMC65]MBB1617129.1 transcriptional regulator [Pseudomonas sp. UMC65]